MSNIETLNSAPFATLERLAVKRVSSLAIKQQRVQHVNEVIRIIASYGRRFFYHKHTGRTASMEVDLRGKVWFIDEYAGKRIYTHETGLNNKWRGFNHGGTLRSLVEAFRDYICKGKPLSKGYLGPERSFSNGNIWGYEPKEMQSVRNEAGALPVFKQESVGKLEARV